MTGKTRAWEHFRSQVGSLPASGVFLWQFDNACPDRIEMNVAHHGEDFHLPIHAGISGAFDLTPALLPCPRRVFHFLVHQRPECFGIHVPPYCPQFLMIFCVLLEATTILPLGGANTSKERELSMISQEFRDDYFGRRRQPVCESLLKYG